MRHYSSAYHILLVILFFVYTKAVYAENVSFESLTTRQGLPQMSVLDIIQDDQGYIWFATRDGMARYDGYSIDVFQNRTNDSLSLSNNYVISLGKDKEGALWIGTLYGLNRYSPKTEEFEQFYAKEGDEHSLSSSIIRRVYVDSKGKVWICTDNGLNLFDSDYQNFIHYSPDTTKNFWINTIIDLDTDNNYLVGTDNELLLFNSSQNEFFPLPDKQIISGIKILYKGTDGSIYIGTSENGLFVLDCQLAIKAHYISQAHNLNSISNNSVRCITEDHDGNILVGTFNGINIFNPQKKTFTAYQQKSDNQNGLSHFSIHSAYCDKDNTIWLGTWAGGVNYFNLQNNNFFQFYTPTFEGKRLLGIVGPLANDVNGIWIGLEGGGLLHYDIMKREYVRYNINNKEGDFDFRSNIVTCLYNNGSILYIGTNSGKLSLFDIHQKKVLRTITLPGGASIITVHPDSKGNILLGISGTRGLVYISAEGNIQTSFYLPSGKEITFSNICSILEDGEGYFLLGSNSHGIYRYNFQTQDCSSFLHIDKNGLNICVNQLYRDINNQIWVATARQGIIGLTSDKEVAHQYTIDDGLKSNTICAITGDTNGNIWASTFSSVAKITPKEKSISNFTGFQVNEFALRSCLRTDSTCYFGGDIGIVSFNPSHRSTNTNIPPVVIKNISINNKRIPLKQLNIHEDVIVVDYNESNITFDYRALNFIRSDQNQYAYYMEGFDKNWIHVSNRTMAHYTNLPAGKYIFHVKACNNDNVWNEEGISVRLEVLPPPWKTWWAIGIYILILLGITVSYLHYLKVRIKLTNDVHIKQMEQENSEKLHNDRINLFTNFSHELRTPLTLIIAPLEELLNRPDLPSTIKKPLELMYSNSKRLLFLINQLMDFRKKEAGKMKLRAAEGNFSKFIEEIVLAFKELTHSKGITLSYDMTDNPINLWYDRGLMEKVLFNLLSNAIKNTPNGGKIEIGITYNEERSHSVLLTIKDTGIGIPEDKLSAIFDPFYQVNESDSSTPGTGIGLYLTKAIVEMHKGRIYVESVLEQGSTFFVELPLGNAHLSADEIIENYKDSEDITRYTNLSLTEFDSDEQPDETGEHTKNKKHTLLIVEDNKELRQYMKRNLATLYNIIEATDGEEAKIKSFSYMPDLIVSDIMMPRTDGIQLCHIIKKDLRTGHIPVILLTARTTVLQVEEGLKIGADDYITKPFNMMHLKARIANLLTSREKLKDLYSKNFNTHDIGANITSADDRFLQKLYSVMEENISNPELNIEKFCNEIGMSKTNLYYKIKQLTNFSPTEFMRRSRLQMAARLLIEKKITISEVSTLVGFNSHSYFCSCFKTVYGCSPTEYVERNGEITSF